MEENNAPIGQEDQPESTQIVEENETIMNMETLLEEEGLALDFPQRGEIRTGVVAGVSSSQILVSVGAKSEGVISGRELENIPQADRSAFEVGQDISVYVLSPEDNNGNVVLSYTRALEQLGWEIVEKMAENDETFEGVVDGFNKGGLIVPAHGLRGFVPSSQISMNRRMQAVGDTPEQRWSKMIGDPISVRVIEVDRSRRRLILSERAASNETRQSLKERIIEDLVEGDVYKGRVTSLADFGAFVNINGADGLVHLSELSWDRVQNASEVLQVGEEVEVKVISIDKEKRRIGLSLRALTEDPWNEKVEGLKVGQLVEGNVTRLTKFGAFARLENDVEGLIHISEISETRIEHPKERITEGENLTLRVIRIDTDQRRIGLSLRKVDSGAFKDQDLAAFDLEMNLDDGITVSTDEDGPEEKAESEAEPKKETTAEVEETKVVEEKTEEEPTQEIEEKPEEVVESEPEAVAEPEEKPKAKKKSETKKKAKKEEKEEPESAAKEKDTPEVEEKPKAKKKAKPKKKTKKEEKEEPESAAKEKDTPEVEEKTDKEEKPKPKKKATAKKASKKEDDSEPKEKTKAKKSTKSKKSAEPDAEKED